MTPEIRKFISVSLLLDAASHGSHSPWGLEFGGRNAMATQPISPVSKIHAAAADGIAASFSEKFLRNFLHGYAVIQGQPPKKYAVPIPQECICGTNLQIA
jgi:hypothetical protein